MKAAVCRFKVEFTSLIKVFILHCIRSCYTSCTPWPTAHSCSSFVFIWNHFYGMILLHDPTKGHNELFTLQNCCFQYLVVSRRLLSKLTDGSSFITYSNISPAMERWLGSIMNICLKTCSVFLWPLPAPGWMNRSCTFGFNGAPRAAHLTVVGLGSAGFQRDFDL